MQNVHAYYMHKNYCAYMYVPSKAVLSCLSDCGCSDTGEDRQLELGLLLPHGCGETHSLMYYVWSSLPKETL